MIRSFANTVLGLLESICPNTCWSRRPINTRSFASRWMSAEAKPYCHCHADGPHQSKASTALESVETVQGLPDMTRGAARDDSTEEER